jgi:putative endopeptidase
MKIKTNLKFTLFILTTFFALAKVTAQQKKPGLNLDLTDKSVRPQDDFYKFVNGTWLKNTEIPADRTRWGSFSELVENTDKVVKTILIEATKNPNYKSTTDQGKAINLYKTILDTVARNKQGIAPIKPDLAKIDAVKNIKDLQKLLMETEAIGSGAGFFGFRVTIDDKNSNRYIVNLGPGALGLPDRDYYVSDEKDSKEIREKYVLHIAKMLQFLGKTPAQAKADAYKILAFEISLAKSMLDRVESRDPQKLYNPNSLADLQKIAPIIDWKTYIKGIGFSNIDTLIVMEPKFMSVLQKIFTENKVEDWKAYMRWTLLRGYAGILSTSIENTYFEFYGKVLGGAIKQRPFDERAFEIVNGLLGEALGKLYVDKMFPAEAKTQVVKMIQNIITAYKLRINNLTWMSPETKVKAIEKLNKLTIKIGYPDKWQDVSTLVVKSPAEGGSFYQNIKNATLWSWKKELAEFEKPVDKTKWAMTPQQVNAYYNPSYNEIVFPAAILQPPFYDYKADEAVNYGGIGGVIAHEISHGFDDQGASYDAEGNLVNWWTSEELKKFKALGAALADQYSALEPLPGVHVDGKFTLGENIGDLGGTNAAFDALQLHLKESGTPGLIDGFTPEQRFFISWATIWREKIRNEALKTQVKTDPHSPGQYRGYVPLLNLDSFFLAFNIKAGDGMYVAPDKRIKIW